MPTNEELKQVLFMLLSGELSLYKAHRSRTVRTLVRERGCGGRTVGNPVNGEDFTCDHAYEWDCNDCPNVIKEEEYAD